MGSDGADLVHLARQLHEGGGNEAENTKHRDASMLYLSLL